MGWGQTEQATVNHTTIATIDWTKHAGFRQGIRSKHGGEKLTTGNDVKIKVIINNNLENDPVQHECVNTPLVLATELGNDGNRTSIEFGIFAKRDKLFEIRTQPEYEKLSNITSTAFQTRGVQSTGYMMGSCVDDRRCCNRDAELAPANWKLDRWFRRTKTTLQNTNTLWIPNKLKKHVIDIQNEYIKRRPESENVAMTNSKTQIRGKPGSRRIAEPVTKSCHKNSPHGASQTRTNNPWRT